LLNAKVPTTDNKHSIWFEKNINNYDLDVPELFLDGAFPSVGVVCDPDNGAMM